MTWRGPGSVPYAGGGVEGVGARRCTPLRARRFGSRTSFELALRTAVVLSLTVLILNLTDIVGFDSNVKC